VLHNHCHNHSLSPKFLMVTNSHNRNLIMAINSHNPNLIMAINSHNPNLMMVINNPWLVPTCNLPFLMVATNHNL